MYYVGYIICSELGVVIISDENYTPFSKKLTYSSIVLYQISSFAVELLVLDVYGFASKKPRVKAIVLASLFHHFYYRKWFKRRGRIMHKRYREIKMDIDFGTGIDIEDRYR